MSSTLILPLCCLNLHNHLIILHCCACRGCALQCPGQGGTELPSAQSQAGPLAHTQIPLCFRVASVLPCISRTCPGCISGNGNARVGSTLGLTGITPCSWAAPRALCSAPLPWISSLAFPQPAWHRFLDSWNTMGAWFLSPYKDSSSASFLILHPKDKTPWWIKAAQQLARLQMCMPWSFTFKAQNMPKC